MIIDKKTSFILCKRIRKIEVTDAGLFDTWRCPVECRELVEKGQKFCPKNASRDFIELNREPLNLLIS